MTAGVEDLLSRFTDPGPQYGPLPIWWWSGARVTRERLRWQMEQLVAGGVRQAVVLCLAPTGPMFGSVADDPPFLSPEWLELFDAACADAEELGFTLWLYDQIGFSGANFQGRLIAAEPGFAGQALFRTEREGTDVSVTAPAGHDPLAAYAVLTHPAGLPSPVVEDGDRVAIPLVDGVARWAGPQARVTLVHAGTSGFDYFSTQACAALLDQVHGTMEKAVGHWFGRTIGGFFQDELPPMPTWGRDFAATFAEAYGYDLLPLLWALWEPDISPEAARVRRDYHAHRAWLARRGFFDQHDAWFAERGLVCGFDQASPAREGDPVGGVHTYGDYLGLHRGYGAPGSDHWGDAKVHSSLAHANGHERTWIEAFHSSGWGGTLEETYDWLSAFLRRGATLYDPHAVYYATVGGWWEWAPPSTCWRQPYWPSYPVFAKAVSRLCAVLTAGTHVADVLLLSPTTTAQAHVTLAGPLPDAERVNRVFRELNGVNSWLSERRGVLERANVDHDALDEATLATGEVHADGLRIGAETYRTVVLPAVSALHGDAAERLLEFAAVGGRVLCVERAPELLLGGDPGVGERFAAAVADGTITVLPSAQEVPSAVHRGPVQVDADAPFLLRRHGNAHVIALTAHDEHTGTEAPILDLHGSWLESGFTWQGYNDALRTTGYRFRPPGDRVARVRVTGNERPRRRAGHRARAGAPSWTSPPPRGHGSSPCPSTTAPSPWSFSAPIFRNRPRSRSARWSRRSPWTGHGGRSPSPPLTTAGATSPPPTARGSSRSRSGAWNTSPPLRARRPSTASPAFLPPANSRRWARRRTGGGPSPRDSARSRRYEGRGAKASRRGGGPPSGRSRAASATTPRTPRPSGRRATCPRSSWTGGTSARASGWRCAPTCRYPTGEGCCSPSARARPAACSSTGSRRRWTARGTCRSARSLPRARWPWRSS